MASYQEKANTVYGAYETGQGQPQVSFVSQGPPPYFGAPPAYYNAQPNQQYINSYNNFLQEREKQLRHAFPTLIVCIHSIFLLLVSLLFIVLQVMMITEGDFIGYIGGGIWAGGFLLFTEIFTLSSLGCRNKCSIIASATLNLVSLVFVLAGCIVTCAIGVSIGPCAFGGPCRREYISSLYTTFIIFGVWTMAQSIAFASFIITRVSNATGITTSTPLNGGFIVPNYSSNEQQITYVRAD